jgi:hypothetical protein
MAPSSVNATDCPPTGSDRGARMQAVSKVTSTRWSSIHRCVDPGQPTSTPRRLPWLRKKACSPSVRLTAMP